MTAFPWQADFSRSPLFAGLEALCAVFAADADWPDADRLSGLARARGICNQPGQGIRFVAQERHLGQREYESRIHHTGEVATRPGSWHDFFNALIWLAYPATKARLNAVQHHALGNASGRHRGALADAATLFDESGLVLVAPDRTLADLLRARRWREAFWENRRAWQEARVLVIGHSLLEKTLRPRPGLTGKCLLVESADLPVAGTGIPAWLDQGIAARWAAGTIARPADLFPLPLFGIPAYADNADPAFYADPTVFRPPQTPD